MNTFTNMAPDIYAALDVVSRELVGVLPAIARDPRADRLAKGTTFRSPITNINNTRQNTVPSMSIPEAQDQAIDQATLTLDVYEDVGFSWTGEEEGTMEAGPGFQSVFAGQMAQCFRTLINNAEATVADRIRKAASRAYGVPGTTPFGPGVGLGAPANVRKILDDNGAPGGQTPGVRSLIVDTTAGAGLRSQEILNKANEVGSTDPLRAGTILSLQGFDIKESAGIQPVTAIGTAANVTTNNAGYAKRATKITLAAGGTGSILAGDIITIAGDTTDKTHQYVVAVGLADVATGGEITIQAPGLMKAIPAAVKAVTVLAIATPNIAFTRNSCLFATRLQKLPGRGDLATDRMTVTDPTSGMSFEVAYYPGYRMGEYKVLWAWGFSVIKPEHICQLLG